MKGLIDWLMASPGYMPHGHCYLWQPGTLWLNVGSDGLIAAAYFAIPLSLYHFVRRRKSEIPFPWLLLMFAAFILLCGSTHLMEIWTVWNPDYRLGGALKLATGLVSLATTLALIRLMPEALKLRTPNQLQREVRERTAELAALNSRLRELDSRKDEFLATLAHELRNPLAPILHAASILGTRGAGAEEQRWGREVIARQAGRMGLLLDDLLNVSRITRGRLELKRETVSLGALVGTAVETARPLIESRRHALAVDLPEPDLDIDVDPLRISQAMSNLLTNAAKFTPAGGHIRLGAGVAGGSLEIVVSDDGAGFAPASVPRLFELFSQATATSDADGGLGIGLSLVKGLVELHGGTVSAASPGEGRGATFTISLPRSVIRAPGAAAGTPAQATPAPGGGAPRRLRVLVVDDNRDAADALALTLQLSGHEVWAAHSGTEALETGRRERPEVVIMDIGMPEIDGYRVARLIRDEPWGGGVFLVAMTGWGQPGDKDRARQAGFDRHFTKPVPPEVIENLLGGYQTTALGTGLPAK